MTLDFEVYCQMLGCRVEMGYTNHIRTPKDMPNEEPAYSDYYRPSLGTTLNPTSSMWVLRLDTAIKFINHIERGA